MSQSIKDFSIVAVFILFVVVGFYSMWILVAAFVGFIIYWIMPLARNLLNRRPKKWK